MKIFLRLLTYAKPYHHFVPEYVIYSVLSIVFGLLNFTLLIPLLDLLFNTVSVKVFVSKPTFHWSIEYAQSLFSFYFHQLLLSKGKMWTLFFVCSLIFLSILLSNLFKYLSARTMARTKINLLSAVRNDLFQHILDQDLSFHYEHKKGQAVSTLITDIQDLENGLGNTIQNLLRAPLVLVFYITVLFYLSVPLTLFTLVFFPLSGLLISTTIKKLKKKGHFSQELLGSLLSIAEEALSGIKIIKSFNASKIINAKFQNVNQQFSKVSRSMFNQREIASPLSEFLGVAIMLVLVLYGGYLILYQGSTTLTGSVFITYLAIYSQMLPPLKDISSSFGFIQKAIVSGERIFKLRDYPKRIHQPVSPLPARFERQIVFQNVCFRYQHEWILDKINLTINKGETIALVGKSGSGKTTLIDLLFRFYDTSEGSILIDGVNIKDMDIKDLQKLMGIVTQEPFLFHDTVIQNICFGSEYIDKQRVEAVSQMAFATDFIEHLEQGYETNIGERGMKLSGGQRQRLTIARALYKNPPILILDEATASLDAESEKYVQNALENATKARTSIVIAHRLSTIQHADRIIVLEQGRVVEEGSHTQLLRLKGVYYQLVQMQAFQ